jgi:1-acyl-sn-glycerol-3-phosphate acyltransferase
MITGVQARWIGVAPVEPDGSILQRIYFANHTSNLDAPVIWAALPKPLRRRTRPVAARDYWLGDPVRRFFAHRVFKAVLIERKRVTPSSNPLSAMEAALDEGCSLIIFPEGARIADEQGEMRDFKPGLWHLARKRPDVQLVPVHLENLNRILPKGDFLLVPLMAAIVFGDPLRLEAGEAKQDFLERARASVKALEDR